MAALTNDFDALRLAGVGVDVDVIELPVKANVKIFAGALLVKETATGLVQPCTAGSGLELAGRAEYAIDNTGGADGAKRVAVRRGVFKYLSAGGSYIQDAPAYGVDDSTVSPFSGVLTIGTNNGALTISAKVPSLTAARVVVSGNNTALSSSIANGVLTINSATDNAGAATSTADAIISELNTNQAASVSAARATGSAGSGVTGAVAQTSIPARASGKVHRVDSDGIYLRCGM